MFAAALGLWFVLGGVLGARHEAQIAHVVDRHTGHVLHVQALLGAHDCARSDIHGRAADHDHDRCALAATLHQAVSSEVARPAVATLAPIGDTPARCVAARPHTAAVYRFAPKTSPPTA